MVSAIAANNIDLIKHAAEQGNAEYQTAIGSSYTEGSNGFSQDYTKALYWYEKAANQGYAAGQYFLAVAYTKGQGVRPNHQRAFYWYEKAANQNDSGAQYSLGVSYFLGRGVQENTVIAKQWIAKSCINGEQTACEAYRKLSEEGY
jgi:TPR repeat protein